MIRDLLANAGQHDLYVGRIGAHEFVFACAACGAWATERPRGLLGPCAGRATDPHRRDLRLLFDRHRLPDHRALEIYDMRRLAG